MNIKHGKKGIASYYVLKSDLLQKIEQWHFFSNWVEYFYNAELKAASHLSECSGTKGDESRKLTNCGRIQRIPNEFQ